MLMTRVLAAPVSPEGDNSLSSQASLRNVKSQEVPLILICQECLVSVIITDVYWPPHWWITCNTGLLLVTQPRSHQAGTDKLYQDVKHQTNWTLANPASILKVAVVKT